MSDGGPAFPVPGFKDNEEFNGMALRDYFAAKAMQGMLAAIVPDSKGAFNANSDNIAAGAYRIADAMLVARGAQ